MQTKNNQKPTTRKFSKGLLDEIVTTFQLGQKPANQYHQQKAPKYINKTDKYSFSSWLDELNRKKKTKSKHKLNNDLKTNRSSPFTPNFKDLCEESLQENSISAEKSNKIEKNYRFMSHLSKPPINESNQSSEKQNNPFFDGSNEIKSQLIVSFSQNKLKPHDNISLFDSNSIQHIKTQKFIGGKNLFQVRESSKKSIESRNIQRLDQESSNSFNIDSDFGDNLRLSEHKLVKSNPVIQLKNPFLSTTKKKCRRRKTSEDASLELICLKPESLSNGTSISTKMQSKNSILENKQPGKFIQMSKSMNFYSNSASYQKQIGQLYYALHNDPFISQIQINQIII